MLKYLYYFLISFILVLLSHSILSAFGTGVKFDIILVILVFITIVWGFNLGFIFAIFIGILLGIYSYLPLGSFVLIYLIIVALVNFLHKNVLINFSLITSIILIILSVFLYNILLYFFNLILYLLNVVNIYIVMDNNYWFNIAGQILFNSLLMIFIFIIGKATFKRLNLVFLIKR